MLPSASTSSEMLSGIEVTGAPGSSNQNQNSVALNTLRSWQETRPTPMYRPSSRSRIFSACQWSQRAISSALSSTCS